MFLSCDDLGHDDQGRNDNCGPYDIIVVSFGNQTCSSFFFFMLKEIHEENVVKTRNLLVWNVFLTEEWYLYDLYQRISGIEDSGLGICDIGHTLVRSYRSMFC